MHESTRSRLTEEIDVLSCLGLEPYLHRLSSHDFGAGSVSPNSSWLLWRLFKGSSQRSREVVLNITESGLQDSHLSGDPHQSIDESRGVTFHCHLGVTARWTQNQ
mmetsp:Transcript_19853/g.53133  ORF Transcript_19853/g.53133 Transcript_19853/m.53133 type:complete len:105 (+) Transcript_19853:556-870(+)